MSFDDGVKSVTTLKQAEGIRDLFLEVYGDQYPVSTYYQPAELLRSQAQNQLRCAIAEDDRGVCGHLALYPSAPSRDVWELGAGLVAKRARGSAKIWHLSKHLLKAAAIERLSPFVFAEAVCNHTITQRLALKLDFVETAIEVDLMPASAYSKEKSAVGRVSSILSFKRIGPSSGSVSLPFFYQEVFSKLYSELSLERDFLEPLKAPMPSASSVQKNRIDMAGLLRLVVGEIGEDFESHLGEKADVFQVMLPLNLTNLDFAVEKARAKGFFLGGLLPGWTGTDTLMMQRLNALPNWDNNKVHSEQAQALFRRIRDDAESVV